MLKVERPRLRLFFHSNKKKLCKNRKISLQTKIRILEATAYGSEARALRKANKKLLDVFQRNCLRIVPGTRLTDSISNSRLYEKCGSIPLPWAIMKEMLRWLGHVLQMKDNGLSKIVLFWPTVWSYKENRSSLSGLGGCQK